MSRRTTLALLATALTMAVGLYACSAKKNGDQISGAEEASAEYDAAARAQADAAARVSAAAAGSEAVFERQREHVHRFDLFVVRVVIFLRDPNTGDVAGVGGHATERVGWRKRAI